jgi:hypothetical protein
MVHLQRDGEEEAAAATTMFTIGATVSLHTM